MLFDLKHETNAFTKGRLTGGMKIVLCGILAGLIVGAVLVSATKIAPPSIAAVTSTNTTAPSALEESDNKTPKQAATSAEIEETQSLSQLLFTKYLFAFEMMGLLLLVIPIGVVALSRSAGGTHAKP